MSKPFSEALLADQLDSDLSWRIKEISNLKSAIKNAEYSERPVFLRALVTLLYAHWEGHVKFCAKKYFEFVGLRKLKFTELHKQFYVNFFLMDLDLYQRRPSVAERCMIIEKILGSETERFSRIHPSLVSTRANLNTEVVTDLCRICGFDSSYYLEKETYIDRILLERRNAIAHGEETHIEYDEKNPDKFEEFVDEGISLMRHFKDLLQNKVYSRAFLAT